MVSKLYLEAVIGRSCFCNVVSAELVAASGFVLVQLVRASSQSLIAFVVHRHELGFRSPRRSVRLFSFCVFGASAVRSFTRLILCSFVCLLARQASFLSTLHCCRI